MEKLQKIPDIFLAYVFTLLVFKNANQYSVETSIQDKIHIPHNNNDVVFEFIDDAIRQFVHPKLLNNNADKYYRKYISSENVAVWLTDDNTIENNMRTYIDNYVADNINFRVNRPSWKKYISEFEKHYLNENFIRSNIIINSVEYLPIIMWGYFQGKIIIEAIDFNITGEMIKDVNNPLYVTDEDIEPKFNEKFSNYDFSCTIDLSEYNKQHIDTKNKKQTETELVLANIDKLVHEKGEGKYVSFATLSDIVLKKGKKYADKNRRIENVVSDYRNKKATDLTLDTKDQESYLIIKNSEYSR